MEKTIETDTIIQDIEAAIPGFTVESLLFEGAGDFCRAYTVNGEWIFRFAYNSEGSCSLEVEAKLLPRLVRAVTLPIPDIAHFGRQRGNGFAFVAYAKIRGVELTCERLLAVAPAVCEQCASDLAGFLRELHSFDAAAARELGVVVSDYPFCRTEEGIIPGAAEDIYRQELARLLTYPSLDGELREHCNRIVSALLDNANVGELPPALVHGDLSHDHVLFDPAKGRITGVIDFTDVIVTTPLLDFMYLYHTYGGEFLGMLLAHYREGDVTQITERVRLLHQWYMALRLLWALDHDYPPGIERGLRELRGAIGLPGA